jgi:hypothetical protein
MQPASVVCTQALQWNIWRMKLTYVSTDCYRDEHWPWRVRFPPTNKNYNSTATIGQR